MQICARYQRLTSEIIEKYEAMNPLLRSNTSRYKAMDNLPQVTPDKFQTNDNVIPIQDHLQQMNSSEN